MDRVREMKRVGTHYLLAAFLLIVAFILPDSEAKSLFFVLSGFILCSAYIGS